MRLCSSHPMSSATTTPPNPTPAGGQTLPSTAEGGGACRSGTTHDAAVPSKRSGPPPTAGPCSRCNCGPKARRLDVNLKKKSKYKEEVEICPKPLGIGAAGQHRWVRMKRDDDWTWRCFWEMRWWFLCFGGEWNGSSLPLLVCNGHPPRGEDASGCRCVNKQEE